MPRITYHSSDGSTEVVDVQNGTSLMHAALQNDVSGIIGDCGGQAMCATCHVYVREEHLGRLPEMSEEEEEMLEVTASERNERRSRLGCQIPVGEGLEEIEVDLPDEQV